VAPHLKVLEIIDSLSVGGAEQALVAMARPLSSRGVSLEIGYLHERAGLHQELLESGVALMSLDGSLGWIGRLHRARQLVLERNPDVVHTTLFEADISGRIAGFVTRTPVVTSLVNVSHAEGERRDPTIAAWKTETVRVLDAVTAQTVVRFHAITNYVADTMARRLAIPRDRIEVIPRGRDPSVLGERTPDRRARARRMLKVGPETPLLLAIGRQERQKGLDVLLDAMSRVTRQAPDVRLFIAGRDGNETSRLYSLVASLDLGETVRFLGVRSDVSDLLCAADVFVLPSRWEGLGSVLIEAMALETPIVASDVPAVREVLDSAASTLVPPDNPALLANAILGSISRNQEAATRARHARDLFLRRFTVDRVADQMVEFYERAIRSHRAASQAFGSPVPQEEP
jgi:glycosyltransferase involved in cell wall biosynthesis